MYSQNYWMAFFAIVFALLLLDLGVFNRNPHEIKTKEALKWSGFWVFISVLFAIFIGYTHGFNDMALFLTAYSLEKCLSIDNLFVFILIFSSFKLPAKDHHKVLYYGIVGSLVLRGAFLFFGLEVIKDFHFVLYLFGAFLVYSGITAFTEDDEQNEINPLVLRLTKNLSPFISCIIAIELSDIMFAVDSVPAVLSVTNKPFIVYTSNIFAVLGLRSLYFALSDLSERIEGLKKSLGFILIFIGSKMILDKWIHIPAGVSLLVILAMIFISIAFTKED